MQQIDSENKQVNMLRFRINLCHMGVISSTQKIVGIYVTVAKRAREEMSPIHTAGKVGLIFGLNV